MSHDAVYTSRVLNEDLKQALENISSLTSFKSTVLSRVTDFHSEAEVRAYLEYVKRKFKWFDPDESRLDETTVFYCKDEQGVTSIHLTGYLIICHLHNGKYSFRGSFVEFHERVTYEQMAYKILISAGAILSAAGTMAGGGATIGLCVDSVTLGAGSIVGGTIGFFVGICGTIFINVNDNHRRTAVEKRLGTAIYDASTNRVNDTAIMEAILLHYIGSDQRYTISGGKMFMTAS